MSDSEFNIFPKLHLLQCGFKNPLCKRDKWMHIVSTLGVVEFLALLLKSRCCQAQTRTYS